MLYDRKINLIITTQEELQKEWDELHIDFSIEKTQDGETPNKSKFIIFNLNKDSREFITKENISVKFRAGYGKEINTLFTGNVIKKGISNEYNGIDWITTIDCQESGKKLNTTKIKWNKEGSVSIRECIDYLITTMGIKPGILQNIPNKKYNNGIAFSGLARDRLTEICKKAGLRYNIEEDKIDIIPIGEKIPNVMPVLNASTGLIGSPIKNEKGISVKCLLNHLIKIGREVKIESAVLNKSNFKVTKLNHHGNNYEGDFCTDFEAISL